MYQMMYEELVRAQSAEHLDIHRRQGIQRGALHIGMEVRRRQQRERRR